MMMVNEVAKLFHDRIKTECEKEGFQSGYRHILFHLDREDGLNQLDLARLTHFKAPTVSVTLQKMESEGIVVRQADETDQRVTRVFLTQKGKELNLLIRNKFMESERDMLKILSENDRKSIRDILGKIIEYEIKAE